jgi:rhamnosyltransferase subunit B
LHPPSANGAKEREAEVLHSIQEVHKRLGTPSVKRVSDLLGLAENVTCCLPELDPYKSVRAEPALGPVQKLPAPRPLHESAPVFGYLNGDDPRTAHNLESLAKASVPCGLYVRQCPPDWAQLVAGSTVQLYPSPQKMPDAVANASAIMHHGGLSTTETALALGRPQFLFPRNLEQGLTAVAVEKLGCGVDLGNHGNPGDAIRRALTRGTHRKEATAVAARIAARLTADVAAQIVALCTKHLATPRN